MQNELRSIPPEEMSKDGYEEESPGFKEYVGSSKKLIEKVKELIDSNNLPKPLTNKDKLPERINLLKQMIEEIDVSSSNVTEITSLADRIYSTLVTLDIAYAIPEAEQFAAAIEKRNQEYEDAAVALNKGDNDVNGTLQE